MSGLLFIGHRVDYFFADHFDLISLHQLASEVLDNMSFYIHLSTEVDYGTRRKGNLK